PGASADIETEWSPFKTALLSAATKCCGTKRNGVLPGGHRCTSWWSPEVKRAVTEKKRLFKSWIARKTPETRRQYEEARNEAGRVVAYTERKNRGNSCSAHILEEKFVRGRRNICSVCTTLKSSFSEDQLF